MKRYAIAVDIGGTFVDAIAFDRETNGLRSEKASTTPANPVDGVIEALTKLNVDLGQTGIFIHGTTLGLNAILERKGAQTGIITNKGFRDIFEIGRADVPPAFIYDFKYQRPPALVKRRNAAGVTGRIDVHGQEIEPLDEAELLHQTRRLLDENRIDSLAVCFLHSFKNPTHEQKAAALLRDAFPGLTVSVSSDITREYHEYERTSTTVLDAYIRPTFEAYVEDLELALTDRGFEGNFMIMRSSGGGMIAEMAKKSPIQTVMSGPAGGIIGAAFLARKTSKRKLLSLDFGGTSLDACLIEDSEPIVMHKARMEHFPVLAPIFDIRCIGAGGGSIAWMEGNILKVGPQSAGADPGPMAYGRGGDQPTTTDAALVLGFLDPDRFLKGEMELNIEAGLNGIARLAADTGLKPIPTAAGVFDVMIAKTVGAIREISVERGHDPKEFSMLAFGGAGPMLAPLLVREMGIPELIIPQAPGVFSAWGMLMSDLATHFARTEVRILEETNIEKLKAIFLELENQAKTDLTKQNVDQKRQELHRSLDLRYLGQEHALEVPVRTLTPESIREDFEALHEKRYGHTTEDMIQIVNLRVRGIGLMDKPDLPKLPAAKTECSEPTTVREAYCFDRRSMESFSIYQRSLLAPGHTFGGPAIVDDGTSTTVIYSDQSIKVDEYGQLIIRSKS